MNNNIQKFISRLLGKVSTIRQIKQSIGQTGRIRCGTDGIPANESPWSLTDAVPLTHSLAQKLIQAGNQQARLITKSAKYDPQPDRHT